MRYWASANTTDGSCSGHFFVLSREGLNRAFFVFFLASTFASAQTTQKKATPKDVFAHRAYELTLAGLRPGRDSIKKAKLQYEGYWVTDQPAEANSIHIYGSCKGAVLRIEADSKEIIQQIVLADSKDAQQVRLRSGIPSGSCADYGEAWPRAGRPKSSLKSPWTTGHKIGLESTVATLHLAYGEPDSRSPSTKDGQPLELWYYAFDWAGPDVPQVMEVLCTKEQGQGAGPG